VNAIALALVLALQGRPPQGAGTVWLAGAGTTPPASERAAVLLVAAPPDSPAPLQASSWGGASDSEVIDVQAGLGPPDVAVLERVRRARRLLLGPGDLAQWRAALWVGPRQSALARCLREAWADGAEVTARGAGALLLGEAWLDVEVDANGRTSTVARPGLGLCAGVTLDGRARDFDLRPVGERLLARDVEVALWLGGESGVRFEPDGGRWVGFGPSPTLAFDARGARHDSRRVVHVLVEWIEAEREGLTGDPRRLSREPEGGPVESRQRIELWSSRHWLVAPGAGRIREGSGDGGRMRLVGLPERVGLAQAAWLELEP
jgi:hypothetical protein